jgi:hypothetical protein
VARYKHLCLDGIIEEMISCDQSFYSMPGILRRVWGNLSQRRQPLIALVGNLSYRNNLRLNRKAYADFKRQRGKTLTTKPAGQGEDIAPPGVKSSG